MFRTGAAALGLVLMAAFLGCGNDRGTNGDATGGGGATSGGGNAPSGSAGSGGVGDGGIPLPTACDTKDESCPLIYQTPPELGLASDVANIVGQRFGKDVTVWARVVDDHGTAAPPEKLEVVSADEAVLQVHGPRSAKATGLVAIYVEREVGHTKYDSTVVFANRPTLNQVSEETVRPGGKLRIWGRQLSQSDTSTARTTVVFRSAKGDIPAKIDSGDALRLTVSVPSSLVPGTKYDLLVGSGYGGSVGVTKFQSPIVAGPKGDDPLNLGVYWGAEFDFVKPASTYDVTRSAVLAHHAKGDGSTDDTAAIQEALDYAGTHGGGVIYAPAGKYKITAELEIAHPKTVLLGAGPSTVFNYGAGSNVATSAGFIAFTEDNVELVGIAKMTVNDLATGANGTSNGAIRAFGGKANIGKVFMADVIFNLNQGYGITFSGVSSDIVVTRSTIECERDENTPHGLAGNGPVSSGADYYTFTDNKVSYKLGRVGFARGNHRVVTGNTLTLDGSVKNLQTLADGQIETGGIEFSFADDVVIAENHLSVDPTPDFATLPSDVSGFLRGCMEHIMSQTSIYNMSDYGTVSKVDGATITDSSKKWGVADLAPQTGATRRVAYFAITDGPGIGQIRTIVGHTATTVTLDSPFDVAPTPGKSSYTVSYFVNERVVIQDNELGGGQIGVLPSAGFDVSVRRNLVHGTHGIRIAGTDLIKCGCPTTDFGCSDGGSLPNCTYGVKYSRTLYWHANVLDNILDNDTAPANGNYPQAIQIHAGQFEVGGALDQGLHGNTVFDVEVRRNQLTADHTFVDWDGWNSIDGWIVVGAWGGSWVDAPKASPYPAPLVAVLGVVATNNTGKNAVDHDTKDPEPRPLKVTANGVFAFAQAGNFAGN